MIMFFCKIIKKTITGETLVLYRDNVHKAKVGYQIHWSKSLTLMHTNAHWCLFYPLYYIKKELSQLSGGGDSLKKIQYKQELLLVLDSYYKKFMQFALIADHFFFTHITMFKSGRGKMQTCAFISKLDIIVCIYLQITNRQAKFIP